MAEPIQFRRDTTNAWTAANPVLGAGEPAVETENYSATIVSVKVGDGVTRWADLPTWPSGSATTVADATDADDVITQLNTLLAVLRNLQIIATA